ncbi:hypothetical protein ACVIGA_007221 [Bradyrhizobium sp. USDA 3240]
MTSIGRSALVANSGARKTWLGVERSAATRVVSGFAFASAVIIMSSAIFNRCVANGGKMDDDTPVKRK